MKSRGMSHSNQVREFNITNKGLKLVEVFLGPNGVLIGSARESQQLEMAMGTELKTYAVNRKDREIQRKKNILQSNIARLQEEFESLKDELNHTYQEEELRKQIIERNRTDLVKKRLMNEGVSKRGKK